jgi:hypothetical protein
MISLFAYACKIQFPPTRPSGLVYLLDLQLYGLCAVIASSPILDFWANSDCRDVVGGREKGGFLGSTIYRWRGWGRFRRRSLLGGR